MNAYGIYKMIDGYWYRVAVYHFTSDYTARNFCKYYAEDKWGIGEYHAVKL